ncbi:MAG TPA: S8 family serine peptidase [Pyrinomonadaceae bacterium]|nr:S8 family serine peptidase [Pyrinomonadaceae bacterium]
MAKNSDDKRKNPRTFQGRPIVTMKWNGQEVEAVQGAFVYRTTSKEKVSIEEAESALMVKVQNVTQPDELGIGLIYTDATLEAEQIIAAADRWGPEVLWIEPVLIDHGTLIPNDTHFHQQWNLRDIKASGAWDIWSGDPANVVLAVLDSGIPLENSALSHQDLNDATRFFLGGDLVNYDDDPADDHGHGTHVAGIAAATTNNCTGIAGLWPGPLLVMKVFDASITGSSETFKCGVFAAVRFAREHKANLIINYSGGGPAHKSKKTAIEHANDNGALIVAAAGNHEVGNRIIFPAAYSTECSNVMAVGAVNDKHKRPAFASKGPEMTVVAPGVDIISSLPNYFVTLNSEKGVPTKYGSLSGTSQAAPLVSALAALVWSKWPQLTATQVRDKIIKSADRLPGSFNDFGHGMINAQAALS